MIAIRAGVVVVVAVLALTLGSMPGAGAHGDGDHPMFGDPGTMMEGGGDHGSMMMQGMHGGAGHDSMMDWMGAWMLFWLVALLLVIALIITALVWLVRNMRGGSPARGGALDELDSSYARGEVSREEYLQRRADLGDRR